jgi:multimeric flavodoxin WrbA
MIVGICGSPRKKATDHVLKEALTMLEDKGFETTFYGVRGKNIGPCKHCDYCLRKKECFLKDDMSEVYELLNNAQGIIIASPMYNGGVSGQIKCIMDRCRALGAADYDSLRGKIGMGIAVGGDRSGGQEMALLQIHTYYILSGVIPVSGGSFGANLGACLWSKDSLDGVKEDKEGFRTLRKTVHMFARYLENYNPETHKKP